MEIGNLNRVNSEVDILDLYEDEYQINEEAERRECIDCGNPFVLAQGEINYFIQHELIVPKRCKPCRVTRKTSLITHQSETHSTPLLPAKRVSITCDHCGRAAEVPFTPFPDSPVYCRVCWMGIKHIGVPINHNQCPKPTEECGTN